VSCKVAAIKISKRFNSRCESFEFDKYSNGFFSWLISNLIK
jgi:hypothetical protein